MRIFQLTGMPIQPFIDPLVERQQGVVG
jgi:hypothetical protein